MMRNVNKLLQLLLIPLAGLVLFSGCGPDLAGVRPDSQMADDGTLQLAQPDIQQQGQGDVMGQSQQQQMQQQAQQQQQQQPQQQQPPPPPEPTEDPANYPQKPDIPNVSKATVVTNKGEIVIDLYPDKAPNTIKNFQDKSSSGFYEGKVFHRVEDWVIQGGDPKGDGTGGGTMKTELNNMEFKLGSVGVARGGDINLSNDSQFFICTTDCSWLTNQYTNFGEVVEGLEIAQEIEIGDEIQSVKVE